MRAASRLGLAVLCLVLIASGGSNVAASTIHSAAPTARTAATSYDASSLVAGYLATPADGLASASTRFKVPVVKCKGGPSSAVTIGLGDLQDVQAPQVRAVVTLACPSVGPAQYSIAVQACSHAAGPLTTKHGHQISVALAQSDGTITMTATDETDGTTISATDSTASCSPPGTFDSVLFGAFPVFAPALLDVPDFNKVKSRDTTLNGLDLSGQRLDRDTEPGIRTSRLESDNPANLPVSAKRSGESFTLKYRAVVHCCMGPASSAGVRPAT